MHHFDHFHFTNFHKTIGRLIFVYLSGLYGFWILCWKSNCLC